MRVVFDTNILISAFVFPGGAPEYAYRAAIQGDIELVTSPVLLAKFARVLSEKFRWDPRMVEEAVSQVARIGTVARPVEEVAVVEADPDDDRVIEAAISAGADIIVSGDRHLVKLGRWESTRILRAADLLREVGVEWKPT